MKLVLRSEEKNNSVFQKDEKCWFLGFLATTIRPNGKSNDSIRTAVPTLLRTHEMVTWNLCLQKILTFWMSGLKGNKWKWFVFGGKTGPSEKSNESIQSSMQKHFGSECHM